MHDMEDEEPPFLAVSELGCLRRDWPRALFTFMARYQFDLDQMRKECRERFGSTQSGACTTCDQHIQKQKTCRLLPHGVSAAVAMSSDLVHGLERHIAGLCRSHEESS